jgi:hypothetical protein
VLVLLAVASWQASALAAPCGRPDVDTTFPPNGATQVPQNARLSAHYAAPALYLDEAVELTDQQGAAVEVTTSYDEAEATLSATPATLLSAGRYELDFPALRGLSSGGTGLGKSVAFFVQETMDTAPPRFAGLTEVSWDLSRERDPCAESLEDRYVFELGLGTASDDADTELLSVLVFETRAPNTAGERDPMRVALRAMPEDRKLVVTRPARAAGETCFAAVVIDMAGNLSGGAEHEVCATTKKPPFFEGCAFAPATQGSRRSLALSGILGAAWLWQLRRRGARAATRRRRAAR